MLTPSDKTVQAFGERLARIESRLVQLMLHMGLDPHKKHYESIEDRPARRAITKEKSP